MSRLRSGERRERSSRRSAILPIPVLPEDAKASVAHLVHEHQEGVAWSQNIELDSRVHLELRVTRDGRVYVESVRVTGVLDQVEPGVHTGDDRQGSDAPCRDSVPLVEPASDCSDALSDRSDGDCGDDCDDDALPHGTEPIDWPTMMRELVERASRRPVRLELRAAS